MTSPGRISTIGPSSHWVQPQPGCHDQGLSKRMGMPGRPGARLERDAGACDPRRRRRRVQGSIRTVPVNVSGEPNTDGCDPARFISMAILRSSLRATLSRPQ